MRSSVVHYKCCLRKKFGEFERKDHGYRCEKCCALYCFCERSKDKGPEAHNAMRCGCGCGCGCGFAKETRIINGTADRAEIVIYYSKMPTEYQSYGSFFNVYIVFRCEL